MGASLAADSKAWSEKAVTTNDYLTHWDGGGENLFYENTPGEYTPAKVWTCMQNAMEAWYDEINLLSPGYFDSPTPAFQAGHFTQIVWVSSTEAGCGYATGPDPSGSGNYICHVTCRWSPLGNDFNGYADNIKAPGGAGCS